MTDHANRRIRSPDLLRCRPDAPRRVRDTLRAAGLDPEPFVAAAGLDANPGQATAAARAYGMAARATGDSAIGLMGAAERPVGWLSPIGDAVRHAPSLAALVGPVVEGLDRLVEGQRLSIRWTREATSIEMTLPAGLDVAGKEVILGGSIRFATRLLVDSAGVAESALRIVSRVPPPRTASRGVAVVHGDRWAIMGPPDLLRRPVDLSEIAPTPGPDPDRHAFLDRVRVAMLITLPHGRRLADVARELMMSPRTLQFRLSEAGTSFGSLLSEVRADVVDALAGEPRRVVAAEVGYASTTALARFQRSHRHTVTR